MTLKAILCVILLLTVGSLAGTATPRPDKVYSYICLSIEQRLCFGISTDVAPVYDPKNLIRLQVKRRDTNEALGIDWMKTRWSVTKTPGRIQLANFTSLCLAKEDYSTTTPGNVVLRPCGSQGNLEEWNLDLLFSNIIEEGSIRLNGRWADQCLTMMDCERTPSTDYCNPDVTTAYTGKKVNINIQRGAHVKLMPCSLNNPSQTFRQTIDCAPGCSPYMMPKEGNKCDKECANDACNWDNKACGTPSPTPPTNQPTFSPTTSPTTSRPTKNPSANPTTSPTPNPTKLPTSQAPTTSPTSSRPTKNPSSSPSKSPSSSPSKSPSTSRPTSSPSSSPSGAPSKIPSSAPTESPTQSPSGSPSVSPTQNLTLAANKEESQSDPLLWLWILLGVLGGLFLCCCCFAFGVKYDNRKREQEKNSDKSMSKEKAFLDDDFTTPEKSEKSRSRRDLESNDSPNVIFLSQNMPSPAAKQPLEAPPKSPDSKVNIPLVLPLQKPANDREADNFMFEDAPPEQSLTYADAPAKQELTPRSAAAQASLSPNPDKKPRGGAPGLVWGGAQDDASESEKKDKTLLRRQSQRLQEEHLSEVLAERSFRMPRENIHENTPDDV